MQGHDTDVELKTLLRGESVDVDGWRWTPDHTYERPKSTVHSVLGLDPNNPELGALLDLYNALLFAFGYKTDGLSSKAPGEQLPPDDIVATVDGLVAALDGDGQALTYMNDAGVLDEWATAKSNAGRLAALLFALSR